MHSQSKLHNNSILTGAVDSYCLVCDNYLRSEDEAFAHIEKPIHKKNKGAAIRVEKFLDDWIIKVKKGYYCQFCNILLTTTTKVTIHIGDTSHQENKGARMLTRVGDNIIAYDEVAITLESWQGLTDNTCVICNTEFNDNLHKTDQWHILRLVQSKCEFGDKYIYRKVDEDSFFCLICASVFPINEKLNHHENVSHKNLYDFGKKLKNKIPRRIQDTTSKHEPVKISNTHVIKPIDKVDMKKIDKTEGKVEKTPDIKLTQNVAKDLIIPRDGKVTIEISRDTETITLLKNSALACDINEKLKTITNENIETEFINEEKQSDILDRVDEFQRKGINIDFTWERARCKYCGENVSFNTTDIEKHINIHIEKKTHTVEPKVDMQKQKNSDHNNVVKPITKVETKAEENKMKNIIHTNMDKSKVDYKVEQKQNANISINIEQKQDTKKQPKNSECSSDKTDTKREPKTMDKQQQKSENSNAMQCNENTKRSLTESKIDSMNEKKSDSKLKQDSENRKKSDSVPKSDSANQKKSISEPKPDSTSRKKSDSGPKLDSASRKKSDSEPKQDSANQKRSDSEPKQDSANQKRSDSELNKDATKELDKLAKENNMVVMSNEVYCPQCNVRTPLNAASINTHINSKSHKEWNTNQNSIQSKKVQAECMVTFIQLESSLGSDVIVNNKYVLRHHSFHCIIMGDDYYKCMLCNVYFRKTGELLVHMNGPDHKDKLGLSKVVISMPEEYIREIAPDIYHCGYCNVVTESWTEMQDHLSRSMHHYARRHAQWNLERCHSVIRNTKLIQISNMHAINFA